MCYYQSALAMVDCNADSDCMCPIVDQGFARLGGYGLYLGPEEHKIGHREPVKDTARVLSR